MFGRPPLSKAPLLIPALAVVAGVWMGCYAPWWFALLLLFAALIFLILRRSYFVAILSVCLAAFGSAWLQVPHTSHIPAARQLACSARIQEVNATNTGSALHLKIDSIGSSPHSLHPVRTTRAVAYTSLLPDEISQNSRIVFTAKFHPCTVTHNLPLETDPNDFLLRRRIFIYTLLSSGSIHAIYPPAGISGWLASKLNIFREGLFRSDLSNRNISFLNTIITGDTSTLLPSERQIFSNAGLAHILALSGMHVALIAWIIALALWPLRFTGRLWLSPVITLLLLWAYAIATGLSPSVLRAVIMATFFYIAYLSFRQRSGLNSLCGAVITILIIWPGSLFSIGFQMSVAAVAAIILFADPLNPIPENQKNHRKLFNLITVPIAAMLGTSAIAAFYFHSLPVYFIFSNLASAILILPTMICGIALGIMEALGFDFHWLATITSWLCNSMLGIADFFSNLPGTTISGLWIPMSAIIPLFIAIILFRFWLGYKSRAWLVAAITILFSTVLVIRFTPRPERLNGVLFPSTLKSTVILFSNSADKSLSVYALATSNFKEDLSRLADIRYKEYAVASRLDSIHVATTLSPSIFLDTISAHCNTSVALLTADSLITNSTSPQILLITHKPEPCLLDSVSSLSFNSILISAAIPPKSAADIASSIQKPNLTIKYLRNAPHFFENP